MAEESTIDDRTEDQAAEATERIGGSATTERST